MQLDAMLANCADQDRGREVEIVNPWDGKPTGIRFWLAGPDSEIQRQARLRMMDDLLDASRHDGTVSATDREKARINCLARCVLRWELSEEGHPVPFNHRNVVRVLTAVHWLQVQVDAFAGDRANFRTEGL